MEIIDLYAIYGQHSVICTDTRKITKGCIFFALKGDKFDANTFAEQAIALGAAYAVIDDGVYKKDDRFILVTDVLTTLQELSVHHRDQLKIPVIGLTGSNGKTTTKELIYSVLSQKFKTQATQGNLNNHIGVPLTLLSIKADTEMAVIEMGANHQKEIAFLCRIAKPTHGLITNVGKAHLEGFGGTEGVKAGKGELYDHLAKNSGIAFVNGNSTDLMEMIGRRQISQVIYYGASAQNTVAGHALQNSPYLSLSYIIKEGIEQTLQTQLTGEYNLDNILAAICIGHYFGVEEKQINNGIAAYQPVNSRSQITKTATNIIIADYYNANPSSMVAALDNIGKLDATKKIAILGDMFELGEDSATEHKAIIETALKTGIAQCIFIGPEFYANKVNNSKTLFYNNIEQAIAALTQSPIKNATILVKGSRGMALERLTAFL